MKVGIIVYSQTGNTLSVAEKLKQELETKGTEVQIVRVEAEGEGPNMKLVQIPDVRDFEGVVFASPVQAFSLAQPMKVYLETVADLSDKKVCCFVTQQLKKAWMGGNHAIKQMKTGCERKQGRVLYTGNVNWSSDKKETQIEDIVRQTTLLMG